MFCRGAALAGCVRDSKLIVSSNKLPCHKIRTISVGREREEGGGRWKGREGDGRGGRERERGRGGSE